MKKIFLYVSFFATALALSSYGVAESDHAISLRDGGLLSHTPSSPFHVSSPSAAECQPGVADIVVHDDGEAENGYGWNPQAVYGKIADPFAPPSYPATITTVCLALITNQATDVPLDFNLVVYKKAASGSPGTAMGTKSFTGNAVSIAGTPFAPSFEAFDISDLGVEITSGEVFVSVEWEPLPEHEGIFLAADESQSTPLAEGFAETEDEPWQPIQLHSNYSNYRAMFIRAVMPESQPTARPAVSVPTLGFWSVLLMIAVLGGAAVRRLM